MPAQLAFFVRAGRSADLESALSSAKLGKSFGYRYQPETNLIAGSFAAVNNFESKPNQLTGLTSQVAAITKRLDDVEMSTRQQQRGGFQVGFSQVTAEAKAEVAVVTTRAPASMTRVISVTRTNNPRINASQSSVLTVTGHHMYVVTATRCGMQPLNQRYSAKSVASLGMTPLTVCCGSHIHMGETKEA